MIAAIGLALSKFGSWVANNRAVQRVLGVLLFIVALVLWGERREGQGAQAGEGEGEGGNPPPKGTCNRVYRNREGGRP